MVIFLEEVGYGIVSIIVKFYTTWTGADYTISKMLSFITGGSSVTSSSFLELK